MLDIPKMMLYGYMYSEIARTATELFYVNLLYSYSPMKVLSNEEQVRTLMKEDLPNYLQNILHACGHDKMSAIANIDVSTDIEKMLQ